MASRFDVLKQTRTTKEKPLLERVAHDEAPSKRGNPDYRQFSAYLKSDTYKRLKVRVAERDIDLSDAVGEAVEMWLAKK